MSGLVTAMKLYSPTKQVGWLETMRKHCEPGGNWAINADTVHNGLAAQLLQHVSRVESSVFVASIPPVVVSPMRVKSNRLSEPSTRALPAKFLESAAHCAYTVDAYTSAVMVWVTVLTILCHMLASQI